MLESSKHAFWEALVITIAVFALGIFIGIAYENANASQINNFYSSSEISLIDSLTLNNVFQTNTVTCSAFINSSINFADRIYQEAYILEQYESAGRLTDSLRLAHTRYDLLRTLLWADVMQIPDKCKTNLSTVVYLYQYDTTNLNQKAQQGVWSQTLFDLKQQQGNHIILIPIAVDSNLTSLDSLISSFNITKYPAVIIDNNWVLYNITTVNDLDRYIK